MASRNEMSTKDRVDLGTLESLALLGERRGKDLLGQLVGLFTQQGPPAFEKLRAALEAGDAVAFSETAHSLKGSYRSLGTVRLAAISTELEERGRDGRREGLEPWIDDLEQAFAETRTRLEAFAAERRARLETETAGRSESVAE